MKKLLALFILLPSLCLADIFACSYKALNGSDQMINVIIEKKGRDYLMSGPTGEVKLLMSEDDKSIRFVNYEDLGVIYGIFLDKEFLWGQVSSLQDCWPTLGCPDVSGERISCTRKK